MAGVLVPDSFRKQDMSEHSVMVASLFFGFTIAMAVCSAGTAARQCLQCWKRSHGATIYVIMIWGHWLANNTFSLISFLYLRDIIEPSVWLWFFTLVLWVFQSQLIVQIIVNRLSLLIFVKSHARMLKWSVFAIMAAINVSVFIIWIPARLEISDTWIHINSIWDRIEKCIFLLVDASLNFYFIHLVRHRLIDNGLTKYVPLYKFNMAMIGISVGLDVVLIGMMSMPNDLLCLQFQSVAYAGKLHIEMNMADLIKKVVRALNISIQPQSSGIGHRSSTEGRTKGSHRSAPTQNHNNFIADITRGANLPYRGHHTTHIELGSHENLNLKREHGHHSETLNGIQKTTVVTQTVDKYPTPTGEKIPYRRSTEDDISAHKSSSDIGLRSNVGP
ncbi:hypothetical protein JX266_014085 [Neoarthrinium moseri]|nr:hypothetical protein JX266_014085 [Neoarthrinium moseri]